jgi:hypothetical protein
LDPGIRRLVLWLRALGFETTDSGDGVSKSDLLALASVAGIPASEVADDGPLSVPHVHMVVRRDDRLHEEARRLWNALDNLGVRRAPGMIHATYDPEDGSAVLSLYLDDATVQAAVVTMTSEHLAEMAENRSKWISLGMEPPGSLPLDEGDLLAWQATALAT